MKAQACSRVDLPGPSTAGQRELDRHRWQLSGVFSAQESEAVQRQFAAAGYAAARDREPRWLCTLYLRLPEAAGVRARLRFYLERPTSRLAWDQEGVLILARFTEGTGPRQERIVETTKERSEGSLRDLLERGGHALRGGVCCYREILEASHSRLTVDTGRQYCTAVPDAAGVALHPVLCVEEPKLELKYGAAMDPQLLELFPARSRDLRTNFEILRSSVGRYATEV